jgi:hypothetical protein
MKKVNMSEDTGIEKPAGAEEAVSKNAEEKVTR